MKIIAEFIRWYLIGFCLALLVLLLTGHEAQADEGISALPTRDGKVLMSKHDFTLLQQFLQAQQREIKKDEEQSAFWRQRYEDAEECARENLKAGRPVMTCFNDLEI